MSTKLSYKVQNTLKYFCLSLMTVRVRTSTAGLESNVAFSQLHDPCLGHLQYPRKIFLDASNVFNDCTNISIGSHHYDSERVADTILIVCVSIGVVVCRRVVSDHRRGSPKVLERDNL